jgi:hypothetical protein
MDDLLQQGIVAYRAGKHDEARKFFAAAVKQNQNDERIWGWMYNVCNNDKERIYCLKQMLRINSKNEKASQLLAEFTAADFPLERPSVSPENPNTQTRREQKSPSAQVARTKQAIPLQKTDSPKKKNNLLISIVVAIFIIICLCYTIFSFGGDGGGDTNENKVKTDHSTMAYVICKEYVKNSLISPSTAKFPWGDVTKKHLGNNIYEVTSYVDAQNRFGAMIRNNYYCKLQYTGGDTSDEEANIGNWNLLDFNLSP